MQYILVVRCAAHVVLYTRMAWVQYVMYNMFVYIRMYINGDMCIKSMQCSDNGSGGTKYSYEPNVAAIKIFYVSEPGVTVNIDMYISLYVRI